MLDRAVYAIPEGAYRVEGFALFAGCVVQKVMVYGTYANKALWWLEALIFAALALFYLLREPAKGQASGPREILVPLLGGVFPFLLLLTPRGEFGLAHQPELLAAMCAGTALALWGYASLNRAFAIMVEARTMRSGGPYRFVRHPVYAGQLFTAAAVAAWRFSWLNLALVGLFALIQWDRARLEERKLAAAFPEYHAYREATGMFLPRL